MGNTHRQCAVQITNNSKNYTLQNPMVYLDSGYCQNSLQSTGPAKNSSALFKKTPDTARGSVGVFTYDLYNESTKKVEKKMAVMFSNPYDLNNNFNLYAVGIFDEDQPCDYNLYYKMYHNTGTEFVRCGAGSDVTHYGDSLTISASMTNTYEPELDVKISSRDSSVSDLTDEEDGVINSPEMTETYEPDLNVNSSRETSVSDQTHKRGGLINSANMTDTHQPKLDVKISRRGASVSDPIHEEDGVINSPEMTETYEPDLNVNSSRETSVSDPIHEEDGLINSPEMTETYEPDLNVNSSRDSSVSDPTDEEDGVINSPEMTETYEPDLNVNSSQDSSVSEITCMGKFLSFSAKMNTRQPELDIKISRRKDSWKKICCIFSCLRSCCTESPDE